MFAAGGSMASSSFRRKVGGGLAVIPGTRASVHNGQLLVSTGASSLDSVIGGGLAVGTLLLIEDKYNMYSNLLLKYFIAEGVVSGHDLFVASAEEDPSSILQELPAPLLDDFHKNNLDKEEKTTGDLQKSMKIAWRYQNLPKLEVTPAARSRFGHHYDLSKAMSSEMLQAVRCHTFFLPTECGSAICCSMGHAYTLLLQSIHRVIQQEGFDGSCPQKKHKNILRIVLQSLGSVLWGDDICCSDHPQYIHSLTRFLHALRGLLRMSLSACVISLPAHLIQNKAILSRVRNLSDTVVGLESFIGSARETNALYKDYHGLFHVYQCPRLNSLLCDVSGTKDLAFKLQRKQFTIEIVIHVELQGVLRNCLHLPPDLSDRASRSSKQDLSECSKVLNAGCAAMTAGRTHLDF
ncbi:elongator complex protein 4 isoform X2 [Microcaecilia unicolor]|uniref:Elongator complex protein 4 n=1 Tax=Microcaecilia unicolor TaxID=1415580 RepID=A0A6P7XU57_9AMPH|nr:elongator complex protein 4 isoform X2 [Microcaecilia unicolor]